MHFLIRIVPLTDGRVNTARGGREHYLHIIVLQNQRQCSSSDWKNCLKETSKAQDETTNISVSL